METRYKDYTMNPAAFLMAKRKEVNEESQRIMLREYKEEGLQTGTINGQINTLTRLLERIYHVDLREWLKRLTKEQLSLAEELILERLSYDEFVEKIEKENS